MHKSKLMIVDDDHMFAEMLAAALAREPGLRVAATARNGAEALSMAAKVRPDLILLDIHLPRVSGLDLIAPLRQELPDAKILMLSGYLDPYIVHRVLQGGVQGYVEKFNPLRVLRDAVLQVLGGGSFFSDSFDALRVSQGNADDAFDKILTERELKILHLMAEGLSDAEIAGRREITEPTVATHRKRMREKLALHSDRELLAYARRCGIGHSSSAPAVGTLQIVYSEVNAT